MRVLHALLGAVVGILVGALGCVVYPGPVDLPWVGLVLAAAIVGSGAWFLLEMGKISVWFGYALGVTVVTFYLLSSPPHNDTVMSVYMWASQAWLIAAPLCALVPAAFVRVGRARPGRDRRR